MRRRSKYRYRRHRTKNRRLPAVLLRAGTGMLGIALLSLFFILCHDVVTQCRYFALRDIRVNGADRISQDRVLHQAALKPGQNILSVNLSVVRKRLLAHPWISEAAVERVIPSGLRITIEEHRPLAILDVGRRFLVDDKGKVFKEYDSSDPRDLPLIVGLGYLDLDLDPEPRRPAPRPSEAIAASGFERGPAHRSVFMAAVNVLQQARRQAAVLPQGLISSIQVDREIGVTIRTTTRTQTIEMGFNDYARKLDLLNSIMAFASNEDLWRWGEIKSIDLKNTDRVVVSLLAKKEV